MSKVGFRMENNTFKGSLFGGFNREDVIDAIKTKDFRSFLSAVKADGKAAVITPEVNEVVVKSARNLPGVTTAPAKLINVYDLLNAKTLVIDKEALAVIEEVFA